MSLKPRYVIEGTWSGYHGPRVCHRIVTRRTARIEHFRKVAAIRFTDGTCLYLDVRPATHGERVAELHGYDKLLDDVYYLGLTGHVSVEQVQKADEARRADR